MSHSSHSSLLRRNAQGSLRLLLVASMGMALSSAAAQTTPHAGAPDYTLTFNERAANRIHVQASLTVASDTLRMSAAMASQLENGWATFVHDLKAFDGTQRVMLTQLPGGRWLLPSPRPAQLSLSYDVVVAHDSVRWDVSGEWARAYSRSGTVFFTGRAVFIASGAGPSTPIRVRFQLPAGWTIATPYRAVPGDPALFEAASLTDLWANGNLAGVLVTREVRVGDLQLLLAGGAPMREGIEVYASTFDPIIKAYAAMMNGAPSGKMVVMTGIAPGASNTGGESFRQSVSNLFSEVPSTNNRARWSYTVAHELFHQWNPNALPPARQSIFEWFVEGFTDYMTRLGMHRAGMSTEEEFLAEMAATYSRYAAVAGKLSLSAAGADKGRNYDLIYFGGSTLAAALDIELRERTGGARGVPQLLARMSADFLRTKEPYDFQGFTRVVSEVAGVDEAGFLARYVDGTDVIPLEAFLARAGITMVPRDGSVVMERSPGATREQKAILAAILAR